MSSNSALLIEKLFSQQLTLLDVQGEDQSQHLVPEETIHTQLHHQPLMSTFPLLGQQPDHFFHLMKQ